MMRLSESVMLQNYKYYLKLLLRQQKTCLWIIHFPIFFVRHTSVTRQWLWSWLPLLHCIIYLTYTTMS